MKHILAFCVFASACASPSNGPRIRPAHDHSPPAQGEPTDTQETDDTGFLPTDSDSDTDTHEPPSPALTSVCFPGADFAYTTCFDTVAKGNWGTDYDYPSSTSAQYRKPVRFFTLADLTYTDALAPNFKVSEFLPSAATTTYGLLQPQLVEHMQTIRTAIGKAIIVTSGYRTPAHNAEVGGATLSRHMYGDAADFSSSGTDLTTLKMRCEDEGASYIQVYTGHIHCDWRNDTLDPVLYGTPLRYQAAPAQLPELSAVLRVTGRHLQAPASGWDEGEPLRRWRAFDTQGVLLEEVRAPTYTAPENAVRVEVIVGEALTLQTAL